MADILVVAGLGNPGGAYAATRHNVGFRVLDLLAGRRGLSWRRWNGVAEVADDNERGLRLIKPQTFMNNAGGPVRQFTGYYRVEPGQALIVLDDFSLPLGALRLRRGGSGGGHNGLSSVIQHMGTAEVPRLRLGIGPVPPCVPPADYVLSPFTHPEHTVVERAIEDAVDVITSIEEQGLERTMSRMPSRNP